MRRPHNRVKIRLRAGSGSDPLRRDISDAMEEALRAAEPHNLVRSHLTLRGGNLEADNLSLSMNRFRRIFVIGGGKASGHMGEEVERIFGQRITAGLVNVPDYLEPRPKGRRIKYHPTSHPIPSQRGVQGVLSMLKMVEDLSSTDLVVCLISGGGSALMPLPAKGVSLNAERETTSLLIESGADIQEINTVRKHLSQFKGGRLAQKLFPATVLTLIISDVVGDEFDAIASGPTVPDPTTYQDALGVLEKYSLWSKVSAQVRNILVEGIKGSISETPKAGDRIFHQVHNIIIGSNKASCEAAMSSLRKSGYRTQILSTKIVGEASQVGRVLAAILSDIRENNLPFPAPAALVAGGEATITVQGNGKGGRNQELVLSAAKAIYGLEHVVFASMATDGIDGPTDAAGAIADGTTVRRGVKLRMDPGEYLRRNDSYHYFRRLGDLISTGPTGTNVNDITILAAK